ncbi:MAG: hypothetical protein QOG55_1381 [Acidobacteriaceae bacterium]|nr:hypothetical protein [Acidobacteriaceae bacterium]
MTNLARNIRIQVVAIILFVRRIRTYYLPFFVHALRVLVEGVIKLDKKRSERRFEELQSASSNWHQRVAAVMPGLKTLNSVPQNRKSQLLAARSSLLEESKQLQIFAAKLSSHRVSAVSIFVPPLTYLQNKFLIKRAKTESLRRIILGIDSNTFYFELLLWLVTSSGYDEALVGDLKEERVFRSSADGEESADSWYRHQIKATLKDLLWMKIQRLAAIGTLIDLLDRWFRK